jgi:ABC-2 type transport system permease protein
MKLFTLAKREYLERVRKRSFLIGTILGPVLMGAMIIVPGLLMEHTPESRMNVAVVDLTGSTFDQLDEALRDTLPDGTKMFALESVPATENDLESTKRELNRKIQIGALDGYLVIPSDIVESGTATYFGRKVSNIMTLERLESGLHRTVVARRMALQGLDYAAVTQMLKKVSIETVQVLKGGEKKSEFEHTFITSFIFIMILYMTILLWGVNVQRSIIEDKTNRIIEILLSSLRSFDIMAGKIIGVGAVGLTQYAIWAVCGVGLSLYALSSGLYAQYVSFSPMILMFFVLFYLLGFLFYSTLFAGVGAVCNSDQEAQQLQTPIVMCLAFTIIVPMAVMQNPDGTFATVLSMVPFFAPILMFMRINILMPPIWQIVLSVAILIASIYLAGVLVAKVFRIGILMYGKRPDMREIVKWMRRA